jgi:hypothetical protein
MTELTLKWHHECYHLLTPKYPELYYSFKNNHQIPGTFWCYDSCDVVRTEGNLFSWRITYTYNYHNYGHYPLSCPLLKTWCFGDRILFPSSGGTYSVRPPDRASLCLWTPATTPIGLCWLSKSYCCWTVNYVNEAQCVSFMHTVSELLDMIYALNQKK